MQGVWVLCLQGMDPVTSPRAELKGSTSENVPESCGAGAWVTRERATFERGGGRGVGREWRSAHSLLRVATISANKLSF